jgi:hypothetical protein
VTPILIASAAPNSVVSQSVGPAVSTVTRSKKPWTYSLCDACMIAAGHTLRGRSRSQAIGTAIVMTMIAKQGTENHAGVPSARTTWSGQA